MLRIAVTGATGFVGQALCAHLLAAPNIKITQLVRCSPNKGIDALHISDLSDDNIVAALTGYDCLIHLAARAHSNGATAVDFQRDNQDLSSRMAQIAVRANIAQLIYLSSIKVLGNTTKPRTPFTHSSKPDPQDLYGRSKLASEIEIISALEHSNTAFTIVRPPLIWGENCKGNLRTLIRLMDWGIPLPFGAIQNQRDLISLTNLCDFLSCTILNPSTYNQTFLVSDDIKRSTQEIVCLVEQYAHKKPTFFSLPHAIFNLLKLLPTLKTKVSSFSDNLEIDISYTKQILNWRPQNK